MWIKKFEYSYDITTMDTRNAIMEKIRTRDKSNTAGYWSGNIPATGD